MEEAYLKFYVTEHTQPNARCHNGSRFVFLLLVGRSVASATTALLFPLTSDAAVERPF